MSRGMITPSLSALDRLARRYDELDCEVCGKTGANTSMCRFEKACSCWYGVPCVHGESIRKAVQS